MRRLAHRVTQGYGTTLKMSWLVMRGQRRLFSQKPHEPVASEATTSTPVWLKSSKTLLGKVSASGRHVLNRFQPWTADHKLALASWFTIGATWWFIAGTSTFLSLALWILPSDKFRQFTVRKVSEYVTELSGIEVTFGSAIRPSWSSLVFSDVRVYRDEGTSGVKGAMCLDLTIDTVEVDVSVLWALEGKGLIKSASVAGVRGVVDRRQAWTMYHEDGTPYNREELERAWDEEPVRRQWYKGSPELRSFSVEDFLVTLYQPEPERGLEISIINWESDLLRRQWLFYDILGSRIEGTLDNQLFSLRPPQQSDESGRRQTRLRMGAMPIDLIQAGITGPLAWLTAGRMDNDSMINFPMGSEDTVYIDMNVDLNHLTAHVPLNSAHMSYLNSALIQPIVVYMNTNYVNIPLHSRVAIPLSKFDGSWTPYEACVTAALSEAVGVEMSRLVRDQMQEPINVARLIWLGIEGIARAIKRGSYLAYHASM